MRAFVISLKINLNQTQLSSSLNTDILLSKVSNLLLFSEQQCNKDYKDPLKELLN